MHAVAIRQYVVSAAATMSPRQTAKWPRSSRSRTTAIFFICSWPKAFRREVSHSGCGRCAGNLPSGRKFPGVHRPLLPLRSRRVPEIGVRAASGRGCRRDLHAHEAGAGGSGREAAEVNRVRVTFGPGPWDAQSFPFEIIDYMEVSERTAIFKRADEIHGPDLIDGVDTTRISGVSRIDCFPRSILRLNRRTPAFQRGSRDRQRPLARVA
jgi:hypothetical protein